MYSDDRIIVICVYYDYRILYMHTAHFTFEDLCILQKSHE